MRFKSLLAIMSVCCITGISKIAVAQNFKLESTPVIVDDKKSYGHSLIYSTDKEFYIRKYYDSDNDEYFLDQYDFGLNRLSTAKIDYTDNGTYKKANFDFMNVVGKNVVIYKKMEEKKSDDIVYVGKAFTLEGGEVSDWRELDRVTTKENVYYVDFGVNVNRKVGHVTTSHWVPLDKAFAKKNKNARSSTWSYNTFDEKLDQVKSGKVELPFTDEEYSIHASVLGEKYNYYLISIKQNAEVKSKRKKKDSPSGFEVLRYELATNKITEVDLTFAEAPVVGDLDMDLVNGKIYIYGMFKKELEGLYEGYLLSRIDETNYTVDGEMKLPFDESVSKALMSPKQVKKNKPLDVGYFRVQDIIVRSNGNVLLTGEYNYSVTTTTKNGSYTTYYSKYILVTEISKEGKFLWSNVINKDQVEMHTTNGLYHYTIFNNDKLKLVFLDNEKNGTKLPDFYYEPEMTNIKNKPVFYCVTILPNGEMTKEEVFRLENKDGFKWNHMSFMRMNKSVLVYSNKKKKSKMTVMNFE